MRWVFSWGKEVLFWGKELSGEKKGSFLGKVFVWRKKGSFLGKGGSILVKDIW
jgi:hypothetical protein